MDYQNFNMYGPARPGAAYNNYVNQYNNINDYDNPAAPHFADVESSDLFNTLFDIDWVPDPGFEDQFQSMFGQMLPDINNTSALVAPHPDKRTVTDLDDSADLNNDNRKRARKAVNGYPCGHPGCEKMFDRAGDRRKHKQRTHMPEHDRPCVCPHPNCGKRFHWQKDVVRHQRQIHHVDATPGRKPVLQLTTHAHDGNESDSKSTSSSSSRDRGRLQRRRSSREPETPSLNMSTALAISRSIVLLKGRIRLRRKTLSEGSGRFIFVTTDELNFRVVDARGLSNAESVIKAIRRTMEVPEKAEVTVHRYHLGQGNRENLDGNKLMSVVMQHADSLGSLKLHLTVVRKEGESEDISV